MDSESLGGIGEDEEEEGESTISALGLKSFGDASGTCLSRCSSTSSSSSSSSSTRYSPHPFDIDSKIDELRREHQEVYESLSHNTTATTVSNTREALKKSLVDCTQRLEILSSWVGRFGSEEEKRRVEGVMVDGKIHVPVFVRELDSCAFLVRMRTPKVQGRSRS